MTTVIAGQNPTQTDHTGSLSTTTETQRGENLKRVRGATPEKGPNSGDHNASSLCKSGSLHSE